MILKNPDRVRDFRKTQISKRKSGFKMSQMINGDRILEDPDYVDFEFKQLVDTYIMEKREEGRPAQPNLEVYLLDENKEPTLDLNVKPLYIIEKIVKKRAVTPYQQLIKKMSEVQIGLLMTGLVEREPSPDLVPIGIARAQLDQTSANT